MEKLFEHSWTYVTPLQYATTTATTTKNKLTYMTKDPLMNKWMPTCIYICIKKALAAYTHNLYACVEVQLGDIL